MLNNIDIKNLTTAFVVFDPDDRILMIRRGKNDVFPSQWGLPAGHVKLREEIIGAAWRELFEETGLPNQNVKLGGYVRTYCYRSFVMVAWWGITNTPNEVDDGKWITYEDIKKLNKEGKIPPNVLDTIDTSKKLKKHSYELSNSIDLISKIEIAKNCLWCSFHEERNRSGWNVYLNCKGVGIIGTALGLLTLVNCKDDIFQAHIFNAIDWLLSIQEHDGGWSSRSTRKVEAISITESTAIVLYALSFFIEKNHPKVSKGIEWLIGNQLPDGSWGANRFSPEGSTYATCIAARAIMKINPNFQMFKTISWIESSQNPDFGWGIKAKSESTPAHTSHAIITLLKADKQKNSYKIKKAVDFLMKSFDFNRLWNNISEIQTIYGPNGRDIIRMEIKHFSTPWASIALLKSGESVFSNRILRSIKLLESKQKDDGSWMHPLAGDNKPIWALHDVTLLFSIALSAAASKAFELEAQTAYLKTQMINITNDIAQIYSKNLLKYSMVPKLSFYVNIFLFTFIILIFYGKSLFAFLALPQIPWYWNLLISTVVAAVFPWVFKLLKISVLNKFTSRSKSNKIRYKES